MNNNNQITNTGFSYDASGDLTSDGVNNYTWNGEALAASANSVNYTYDGNRKRVEKSNGTLYWYGASGEVLTETDLSGNPLHDYIYFGGKRIARREPSGTVYYYFQDHLGTALVMTDPNGNIQQQSVYYPFGGERVITNTVANNYRFTGLERDTESGLDHTLFRQYTSNLGRWLSPELAASGITNPQSLNRYAYVLNNPLTLIDPLGLDDCPPGVVCVTSWGPYPTDPSIDEFFWTALGIGASRQVPDLIDFRGGGGGGNIPTTFPRGRAAFASAAKSLAKMDFTKKPNCMADFKALGVSAAQVQQGCGAAIFLNGIGSNVLQASLYASAAEPGIRNAPGVSGTVGDFFANNPGAVADSQLGGHDIYINAGLIDPTDFYQNEGVVLHEVLHNVTGLTDSDIQKALGLTESKISDNITQKLIKDCL